MLVLFDFRFASCAPFRRYGRTGFDRVLPVGVNLPIRACHIAAPNATVDVLAAAIVKQGVIGDGNPIRI